MSGFSRRVRSRTARDAHEESPRGLACGSRPPWWREPLPPVPGNPPPRRPIAPPEPWHELPAALAAPSPMYHRPGRSVRDGTGRPRRQIFAVSVAAAVLLSAAVSGVVAWTAGAAAGRHAQERAAKAALLDPNASLPVTEPSVPRAVPAGSVTAIAAAIVPSVVTVHVRSDTVRGTGAGVIIRSDGYILTNDHVVDPDGSPTGTVTVDLSAARADIPAQIVGQSPIDDLAVIKIDVSGLRAARLGRSSTLRVGDEVVAVGAPLGLSGSVTSGIVSALARNVDVPGDTSNAAAVVLGNAIQTDAAINPGNSGGALVDASGSVVGINSAIASTASAVGTQSGSIGVGFAIPIDYARAVADQLIRTGKATHAYLGLVPDTVNADSPIPGGPAVGAYVRQVLADTPASRAGLARGDVIVALDGHPITSADDLIVATRTHRVGQVVTITYVRSTLTRSTKATLAASPAG